MKLFVGAKENPTLVYPRMREVLGLRSLIYLSNNWEISRSIHSFQHALANKKWEIDLISISFDVDEIDVYTYSENDFDLNDGLDCALLIAKTWPDPEKRPKILIHEKDERLASRMSNALL